MKNVLLFLGANSSAANISLDSSVLNIDNTTIFEEDTDTESILGQAHHMLSRFLNLRIFFKIFFTVFFYCYNMSSSIRIPHATQYHLIILYINQSEC